ncbi:glycosyltransferase family 2 protein [Sulfitobacter sp. 1151]|uniref:Glycosyltransferase family 2 protein n=1 Tax=Parasulfitobacter algicola TaxID=2614809 RepID=A0ABX2IV16_9RHOB|nr:glycosyltransferase family 2 protein [Sulfitobacter algicola]
MIRTLKSIADMNVPKDVILQVIVVDNDVSPTAKPMIKAFQDTADFPVIYAHKPAGNISIARNGALEISKARFLAFIDDDETVSRDWLMHLLDTQAQTGAGVVLGPVQATYMPHAPKWMKQGVFHDTKPVWVNGQIQTGYTCNVLLDRDQMAFNDLTFDLEKGQTGGEDTSFFHQLFERDVLFAFAPQAVVSEAVPDIRATLKWLAERRKRMGQTQAEVYYQDLGLAGKCKVLALSAAKIAFCMVGAALTIPLAHKRNAWFLRGMLHVGVISALFGARAITPYGLADKTAG